MIYLLLNAENLPEGGRLIARNTSEFSSRQPDLYEHEQENHELEHQLHGYADGQKAALEFIHRLQEDHSELARELQSTDHRSTPSWLEPDPLKSEARALHNILTNTMEKAEDSQQSEFVAELLSYTLSHNVKDSLDNKSDIIDHKATEQLRHNLEQRLDDTRTLIESGLNNSSLQDFTKGLDDLRYIYDDIKSISGTRIDFVHEALKDNPDPRIVEKYIFGDDSARLLSQNHWEKIQDYLAEEEQLTPSEMRDFANSMYGQATAAARAALEWDRRNDNLLEGRAKETHEAAEHVVWTNLEEKSAYLPIEPFHHPDGQTSALWNKVWDKQLDSTLPYPAKWTDLEHLLQTRQQEINNFNDHGKLPDWLNPEGFTQDRMTLTPENEALGYNNVHHQPIDLLDRTDAVEGYLRERMDAYLDHRSRNNDGLHPAEFAKELIKPYTDEKLATEFHRFDGDNRHYVDDGPINYYESAETIVEGDTTHPANHLKASYARLLRDSLMERGLAHDSAMDRADLLAMSLPRNAVALQRTAEFSHTLIDTMDPSDPRESVNEYGTSITWNNSAEENMEAARALADTSDNKQLRHMIIHNIQHLAEAANPETISNPDSWTQNYSFMPRGADPGTTDIDHPGRFLLREALRDMTEALDIVESLDKAEARTQAWEAHQAGNLEDKLEEFAQDLRSPGFIQDLQHHVNDKQAKYDRDQRFAGIIPEHLMERYRTMHGETRDETPANASDNDYSITLAVNRLAHADFNVQAVLAHTDLLK